MFNIFNLLKEQFLELAIELAKEKKLEVSSFNFDNFTVEPVKETKHGDISCNIAMTISKSFLNSNINNPLLIDNALVEKLNLAQKRINEQIKFDQLIFKKIEIAKAGFINIFLTFWARNIKY
jgi:arginyl-tRNA synthetase